MYRIMNYADPILVLDLPSRSLLQIRLDAMIFVPGGSIVTKEQLAREEKFFGFIVTDIWNDLNLCRRFLWNLENGLLIWVNGF